MSDFGIRPPAFACPSQTGSVRGSKGDWQVGILAFGLALQEVHIQKPKVLN